MTDIRCMVDADLEFAVDQTVCEGWATGRHMFEIYLAHDPGGCFVAEEDGELVGMVTTTRYRWSAWIGNLIVPPEARSRGIGRALMRHGLTHLEARGAATVRLDGDPPGIPLYRSLGFEDEWQSLRFEGKGCEGNPPPSVAPFGLNHLAAAARFDREVFGDDRLALLRLQLERAQHAFVIARGGEVAAFLFLERTNLGMRIGPWVADDTDAAGDLLQAARIAAGRDCTVALGVPEANEACCRLLELHGFISTPPSLRMIRGPRTAAGRLDAVYGIGGGAIG